MMNNLSKIRKWAIKHYNLYSSSTANRIKHNFKNKCISFGFNDLRNLFALDYKKYFIDKNHLNITIIKNIYNPYLLGSIIYSYYLFIDYDQDDINYHNFFMTAFRRLAIISSKNWENPFVFKGELKKVSIKSFFLNIENNLYDKDQDILYGKELIEINRSGKTDIYFYINPFDQGYLNYYKKQLNVADRQSLFRAIEDCFKIERVNEYHDSAEFEWSIVLTNTENKTYTFNNTYIFNGNDDYARLSDFLRLKLNIADLYCLDGNADLINKIIFNYHAYQNKIDSKELSFLNDTYEELVIDNDSKSITYNCSKPGRANIAYTIQSYFIETILKEIPWNSFDKIVGNSNTSKVSPYEAYYHLEIYTLRKRIKIIDGSFDKFGLPVYWPVFIEKIKKDLTLFNSEIFDESFYSYTKKRKGELIFCRVSIEGFERQYWYRAKENIFMQGDLVIVPFGKDNIEKLARIEKVIYSPKNRAPYPIDKLKYIYRKTREGDLNA